MRSIKEQDVGGPENMGFQFISSFNDRAEEQKILLRRITMRTL